MKKTPKADEVDRDRVVRSVEDALGVQLSKVGRRPKWLQDGAGRKYWVLVGTGDWMGVPQEMVEAEIAEPSGGLLVIASRLRERLRIFVGPILPLLEQRSKLPRNAKGDYQFNLVRHGERLHIKELPGFALHALSEEAYSEDEKTKDREVRSIKRAFAKLSPEDRTELLREIREKKGE